MSSREIAELTGKRHDHVMRDIRSMLVTLQINGPTFGGVYVDAKGEARSCFNLPKRETLILVSGYSVELRARIIDRWMELEAQAQQPQAMTATEVTMLMAQDNRLKLSQLHEVVSRFAGYDVAALAKAHRKYAPSIETAI
ncbi:hypothetical protein FAA97_02420 [Peteryoungia ipomoeae]|uniref:Uncharacterized protein n=1 Tax=Peteryoungia ipomoeae TaxID=1210932 RepID=A0A4S8PC52_9HYPH|nr:hypothetical protein FAA97_02420 [Peteryoungia ipomoeae]